MLNEKAKELLALAIDGGLDERQERAVQHLLKESAEARRFVRLLKQDSRQLKKLARMQLPASFANDVVRRATARSKAEPVTVASTAQRLLPMWANAVAALSILVAVSVGTYIVATMSTSSQSARQTAEKRVPPIAPAAVGPSNPLSPAVVRRETPGPLKPDVLPLPRPIGDEDDVAAAQLPEFPEASEPKSNDVLTIPFNPKLELFKVELPKLPPVLLVRELNQAALRTTLLESVSGDDGYHLDLFCKDANRAFERLQTALKGQGRKVIVEALAQVRLQAKVKTNYVIYCETMSANDLGKLFDVLSAEERRSESALMEKLVITPMSAHSQRTLAALLGIDPRALNLKAKPAVHDPTKPISDGTADNIARALAEKDRPNGAKPADSAVLAMSFNPIRPNPAMSREVRDFLSGRRDRKPGTPALMIVIRNLD